MSKSKTTVLDAKDLRYLLIDNLKIYSDNAFFVEGSNPYIFTINGKIFNIFIRNTHSSGAGRTNPDECRIQINKSSAFTDIIKSGELVVFLVIQMTLAFLLLGTLIY